MTRFITRVTGFFLPVLVVAAVLWVGYGDTLQHPFVFDDYPNVVDNHQLRLDASHTWRDWVAVSGKGFSRHRVLPNLTFALNFALGGTDVRGFRLLNILIHLATALVFYWLASLTLDSPALRDRFAHGREIALMAALLWAAHPLQTNAVTYIVQRMTSLAAFCFLAAMLCYVRGRLTTSLWRRSAWFGGCLVSGFLAVVSKENAAMLPVMIVAYESFFLSEVKWRQDWRRLAVWVGLGMLFIIGLAWLYMGKGLVASLASGYKMRNFTMVERLLTEPRVLFFYLSLLVLPLPSRLNLNHYIEVSRHPFSPPQTAVAILGLVALLVLAVFLYRRERLLSFAIVWFLGNLAIESTVIPLELVFEHRLYLPSTFVILTVVAFLYRLSWRRPLALARVVAVVAIVGCALLTRERNVVWASELSLWSDVVTKSPLLVRGYANLGRAYLQRGRFKEAEAVLLAGLAVDRRNRNRGAGGIPPDGLAKVHDTLGIVYWRLGELDKAVRETELSMHLDPRLADALITRGILYETMGQSVKAISMYEAARAMGEDSASLYLNWAVSCFNTGREEEAFRLLNRALVIEPDNPEAHYNLGIAYSNLGLVEQARQEMARAMELRQQKEGK